MKDIEKQEGYIYVGSQPIKDLRGLVAFDENGNYKVIKYIGELRGGDTFTIPEKHRVERIR